MAKSLRSKWKRKMKAVKRERYGEKELAKLKMIVEASKSTAETTSEDTEMTESHPLIKYVPKWRPSRMARRKDIFGPKPETTSDEPMETNKSDSSNPSKFPVWMSSHRKKKMIAKTRLINKQKKKEIKKAQKKKR